MSDNQGWNSPCLYETIRTIPIKSKLFILGIRFGIVHLLSFSQKNSHLELLQAFEWLENSKDWDSPNFYKTVNINKIDEIILISVKSTLGINLLAFNTEKYQFFRLPCLDLQHDWNKPEYYKTIKTVVCNKNLYIFCRQRRSIFLAKFDTKLSA